MIRSVSLSVVLASLMGCPVGMLPDGGTDAGGNNTGSIINNPNRIDACSGGCDDNQICDADGGIAGTPRTCINGCGGCDAGVCRKVAGTPPTYQCFVPTQTCNGAVCEPGQQACVSNSCSCLVSARSTQDTCQSSSKWCNGKSCQNPRRYEECTPGGPSCPAGEVCTPVFSNNTIAICLKDCSGGANACDVGEACASTTPPACLPSGIFPGQDCSQNVPLDGGLDDAGLARPTDGGFVQLSDGGFLLRTVPVGNTCLLRGAGGVITDNLGAGRGNCTYAALKVWRFGLFPIETCNPPGTANLGDRCVFDLSAGAAATRCNTGLECAYTRGRNDAGLDEGVCLKTCNANPGKDGFVSQPSCGAAESCVNLYRYTDPNDNAVVGVCMKNCNVFNASSASCANVGASATSCVPASADGQLSLTYNGDGICVPQQAAVSTANAGCGQTDVFRGASCGNAQVCSSFSIDQAPTCLAVCDVSCNPGDGGVAPARCATQPNARCTGGKTCRAANTAATARVGYCL